MPALATAAGCRNALGPFEGRAEEASLSAAKSPRGAAAARRKLCSVCDVMAKGSRHIRRSCAEMEEMREQFERVLGVRLSDKAGKLSGARSHAWRNGCS